MGLGPCFPAWLTAGLHNNLRLPAATGRLIVQKAPGRWGRPQSGGVATSHSRPGPTSLRSSRCCQRSLRSDSGSHVHSPDGSSVFRRLAPSLVQILIRFELPQNDSCSSHRRNDGRNNPCLQACLWVASPEPDILPASVLPQPGAVFARDERSADVATCSTPACAPERSASRRIVRLRLPAFSALPCVSLPKNSDAGWH
jgi:hypothetical protein